MAGSVWLPSVDDVVAIHDAILTEYPNAERGIRDRGAIEYAVEFVKRETDESSSIHDKAYDLLRLLTANHPFVDGNKRTALNTVAIYYFLNGFRFTYDDRVRAFLKGFGHDASTVDRTVVVDYLRSNTDPIDLDEEIDEWREELLQYGVDQVTDEHDNQNG